MIYLSKWILGHLRHLGHLNLWSAQPAQRTILQFIQGTLNFLHLVDQIQKLTAYLAHTDEQHIFEHRLDLISQQITYIIAQRFNLFINLPENQRFLGCQKGDHNLHHSSNECAERRGNQVPLIGHLICKGFIISISSIRTVYNGLQESRSLQGSSIDNISNTACSIIRCGIIDRIGHTALGMVHTEQLREQKECQHGIHNVLIEQRLRLRRFWNVLHKIQCTSNRIHHTVDFIGGITELLLNIFGIGNIDVLIDLSQHGFHFTGLIQFRFDRHQHLLDGVFHHIDVSFGGFAYGVDLGFHCGDGGINLTQ
mmetsp:Transcript_3657/g.5271  ORF Transcript_3657/g.5271 Transcript_3657/m.5271 type:complete len:310 (+) Transcript_3657:110-1039(+)